MKHFAVIFDMDGVLIDSERFYDDLHESICREQGIELPEEFGNLKRGQTSQKIWTLIIERYGLKAEVPDLLERETEILDQHYAKGHIEAIPGAFELMARLYKAGFDIAVATSNRRSNAVLTLQQNNAQQWVSSISSCESIEHSKPAPDIFLHAAKELGLPPENCLVIEDSPNGVKAGLAAGMTVIAFNNTDYPPLNISAADKIIDCFDDLSLDDIENLLNAKAKKA